MNLKEKNYEFKKKSQMWFFYFSSTKFQFKI